MNAFAMEKPASRQEPRRLKTRAALLAAGLKLLADRPIDGISVDDIVRHAGVAREASSTTLRTRTTLHWLSLRRFETASKPKSLSQIATSAIRRCVLYRAFVVSFSSR